MQGFIINAIMGPEFQPQVSIFRLSNHEFFKLRHKHLHELLNNELISIRHSIPTQDFSTSGKFIVEEFMVEEFMD